MRAYMWDQMKDWLLKGAIETDEKMAMDLAGPGYHIYRNNLLVIESKADMQKRGQASPDDGDALALTFAKAVALAEKERERDEDEEFGRSFNGPGAWMR
jgi:phage terminase large subunit